MICKYIHTYSHSRYSISSCNFVRLGLCIYIFSTRGSKGVANFDARAPGDGCHGSGNGGGGEGGGEGGGGSANGVLRGQGAASGVVSNTMCSVSASLLFRDLDSALSGTGVCVCMCACVSVCVCVCWCVCVCCCV